MSRQYKQFEVGTKVIVTNTRKNFPHFADCNWLSGWEINGVKGAIVRAKRDEPYPSERDTRIVLINGHRYCIGVEGLEEIRDSAPPPTHPVVTAWAGGDNPVPGCRVKVWLRNGWVYPAEISESLRWDDAMTPGDILYYKVVSDEA